MRATIGRSDLLAAIETVLTAFQEDPELIFRRLCFLILILPLWGLVPGRTDIQNVKLPGKEKYFELVGGIDCCMLREYSPVLWEKSTHLIDVPGSKSD